MTCAEFQALQAAAADDPQPLIENALWITTKGEPGQPLLSRLVLNHPQQRVHGALMQMRATELPPRGITLKARQVGISTLGLAELLATALCRPHTMSMLIAHVDEAAEKLFRRILFMVERLPPDLRPRLRPPRKDELYFEAMPCSDGDVPLGSSIAIATASGREVWRSQTLTSVLMSEYARFPYPEATLLGVLQSVPKSPGTLVLIESSAQGMGNDFHTQYVRAEAGESAFVAVFVPWFSYPNYTMPAPADFEPDQEEWAIKRAFGLTNDQLQWRRYTIATDCQGNIDRFMQEYAETASGSFLATGMPAFDAQRVSLMYERARTREPERGEWTERGFLPMRKGRLALWARPTPGHEYVIGADIATGIEGGDLSAACIFDRITSEQVGEWAGYMTPIEFAQVLLGLGRWYDNALLAPEVNTHGFCLRGDTLIPLPFSRPRPIAELAGTQPWVYAMWEGRLQLAQATQVWCSQSNAECVRVVYRWQRGRGPMEEGSLVCTPSHPVMLLNGEYRRAAQLMPADRLMPFGEDLAYRMGNAPALRARVQTGVNPPEWSTRARWIWESLHGPVPPAHDVHHLNEDALDDRPENLECILHAEHIRNHSAGWSLKPDVEARRLENLAATWRHEEVRRARLEGMKRANQRPEWRARKAELMRERWKRWRAAGGGSRITGPIPNHRVVRVEPAGRADVYDMEVPHFHNFAADTIFVHNSVIEELKRSYYEKIHRWQRVDRVKNTVTWWLGWETSFKSRGLMIDSMDWAIRKGEIMLWSLELLREMQGFQYVSRRRAEGLDHDDRLFAAMIAYRVHLENPLDSTGFPPFVAEPVLTGAPPTPEVPLPARNVDRQVWEEVDDEMRTQGTGRRPAWQEYGTEPEPDPHEKPWFPGGDW